MHNNQLHHHQLDVKIIVRIMYLRQDACQEEGLVEVILVVVRVEAIPMEIHVEGVLVLPEIRRRHMNPKVLASWLKEPNVKGRMRTQPAWEVQAISIELASNDTEGSDVWGQELVAP